MSYANRQKISSNRTASIIVVALLHVVLGYALVSGLAYNVVKKAATDLKTFDVNEPPPPPEDKPPPPPPEKQTTPPPPQIAAPPPLVRMPSPPVQIQTTPNPPPFVPTPTARPAPPAPPAPPPAVKQSAAKSKGSLAGLITSDDYPASAQQAGVGGRVRARLQVGANGRVTGCAVTSSSGNSALDSATCSVLTRRARFTPAIDSNGQPTSDTVDTPTIVWVLEEQ